MFSSRRPVSQRSSLRVSGRERPPQSATSPGAPGLRGRTKGNLNATLKNNNASHELLGAAPPTGYRTDRTNTKAPTTILAVVGAGVDILRRRPHLVDPDDAQRQHPEGPLLLDDDRLQCLGGRKLDVSQYGSHDLTAAGQDYQTILRHYYRDIALSCQPLRHTSRSAGSGSPAPRAGRHEGGHLVVTALGYA